MSCSFSETGSADANLFLTRSCRIPAGHTAAPTYAVAEKMADVIKAEYAKA